RANDEKTDPSEAPSPGLLRCDGRRHRVGVAVTALESDVEVMVQDTGPEDPTRRQAAAVREAQPDEATVRQPRPRAFGLMLVLSLITVAAPASAQLAYVGSPTIGENIIPEAAEAFVAKAGIRFGGVQIQGSGKGLDLDLAEPDASLGHEGFGGL